MPGSSNFIQVNPGQANQETDAAYASDPTTAGGVGFDSITASAWFNKFAYQVSTFVAAFGSMMAGKGYSVSDASESALAAVLAHVATDAGAKQQLLVVPYSPNAIFDGSLAKAFQMSLTGNLTAPTLINTAPGDEYSFLFFQDAVGGRTIAWPSNVTDGADVAGDANQCSIQKFIVLTDGYAHPLTPMVHSF